MQTLKKYSVRKKASDITQSVKDMIKKMDIPTQFIKTFKY